MTQNIPKIKNGSKSFNKFSARYKVWSYDKFTFAVLISGHFFS